VRGDNVTDTPEQLPAEPSPVHKPTRSLWDWLQLLLIPVILVAGFGWLSFQQAQLNLQLNRQQQDTALQVTDAQQQTTILSNYEAHISDMMLHDGLRTSQPNSTVALVAEVDTATALRQLEPAGKGNLLRFLYETTLINNDTHVIGLSELDAHNANLVNIDLRDTYLFGLDMHGSDMQGINLSFATLNYVSLVNSNLAGANLQGCDMRNTDLTGANLSGANLKDATELTDAQLAKARSLTGATLPDGSLHP
jgi:uncharacterized protein YjbI with pentapeptide repeats